MDLIQLPITAEMREAFRVGRGAPIQVEDPLSKKLYVEWSDERVIAEAERLHAG